MRLLLLSFAIVATAGVVATESVAQNKKSNNKEQSQEQAQPAGNYPRCEGTLFLTDGTSTQSCRRSDGKICSLVATSGGNAELRNCR